MIHFMPFAKVILEILRHRLFDEHWMRYNEKPFKMSKAMRIPTQATDSLLKT
jgi:hypothetical protein